MNFPPCGFKLPGHRPCQHLNLLLSCSAGVWPSQRQAAWGVSLPQNVVELDRTTSATGAAPALLVAAFAMSARWPRSTGYQGWQLGRSSGSSLGDNGQLSAVFVEVDPVTMPATSITSASSCFLCLPMPLWPWLVWPQCLRVFLSLDGMLVAEIQEKINIKNFFKLIFSWRGRER